MKSYFLFFIFLIYAFNSNIASVIYSDTNYVAGVTYYGNKGYTIYIAGNMPLILTAPHGGSLAPDEIPDRTYGDTDNDLLTKDMAQKLQAAIYSLTGKYPHVIINNLKRIKLDANRDSLEGAQGNSYALQTWKEYHGFIKYAKQSIISSSGKGLLLDLHGHGHTKQRIELGYLLSSELGNTDEALNGTYYINQTSIKNLVNTNSCGEKLSQIIRGANSLGTLLRKAGYPAVPSDSISTPGTDDYFEGGYTTQTYGSMNSGTLDAIQVEHNKTRIRDSEANLNAYIAVSAPIIIKYLNYYYSSSTISVNTEKILTADYYLMQNYPNPFNPSTKISFTLSNSSYVRITIIDLLGREISRPVDQKLYAGTYTVNFNGANLPSGIYLYRMETDKSAVTKKMILVK